VVASSAVAMTTLETTACVVGAGPGGLVLAHLLRAAGISTVVLERAQAGDVRAHTRAGLIEHRTFELLRAHGLADGVSARGVANDTCEFRYDGASLCFDYGAQAGGRGHRSYPQHLLVGELVDALAAAGGAIRFGVRATRVLQDADGATVTAQSADGNTVTVRSEIVAGCDGAHGVVAGAVASATTTVAHSHPFRWLALIAAAPPPTPRTVYALHPHGFAGQMRRGPELTRYYLEIPRGQTVADWPDERVWPELARRFRLGGEPGPAAAPLLERAVLDLRVRTVEPMQVGRVFLVGDAAHLLTPAGGKGMNLAIQDAIELACGLRDRFGGKRDGTRLAHYSATRLAAAWRAQEFSDWMLGLLHAGASASRAAENPDFAYRLRRARIDRLRTDAAFAHWFAHAYAGVDATAQRIA
jgi:p-hydroxybenzoate 3-monooxygenase